MNDDMFNEVYIYFFCKYKNSFIFSDNESLMKFPLENIIFTKRLWL